MPMVEYDTLQDMNDNIILAHKLAMGRPVTRDDIEKFIARASSASRIILKTLCIGHSSPPCVRNTRSI